MQNGGAAASVMPETIHLTVRRVRFRDPSTGFTVADGTGETSGADLTFVGTFAEVPVGEAVSVTGEWRDDKKWGRQFAAESLAPIVPTSAEGIESYLAAGHVKGVGAALAKRLVERFGADIAVNLGGDLGPPTPVNVPNV